MQDEQEYEEILIQDQNNVTEFNQTQEIEMHKTNSLRQDKIEADLRMKQLLEHTSRGSTSDSVS